MIGTSEVSEWWGRPYRPRPALPAGYTHVQHCDSDGEFIGYGTRLPLNEVADERVAMPLAAVEQRRCAVAEPTNRSVPA